MAFDAHKNLAISAVVTAPTPATSGTSLVVTAGHGARFPAAPFNATVWPANAPPDPLNAEVIRVTARATDTLTIARAQEGSTARLIGVGDLIAQTITAKTLTDLETRAALKDEANVFTLKQTIERVTPQLVFTDLNQVPDSRTFDLVGYNLGLSVRALNDAQNAVIGEPIKLRRDGDVLVGKDLYEKGRVTAIGHWLTGDVSAITHTAGFSGPMQWMMLGRTMFFVMSASGTMPAQASFNFNLPVGGLYSAATFSVAASVAAAGLNWRFGSARFTAANYFFTVFRDDGVAWPAGLTQIQLFVAFPIQ
jgi:hypothetical protein